MSIRTRIALLSATLMTVLLLGVGTGVYFMLQRSMQQEIDSRLERVARTFLLESRVTATSNSLTVQFPRNVSPFEASGSYIQVIDQEGEVVEQATDWFSRERTAQLMALPDDVFSRNQNGETVSYSGRYLEVPELSGGSRNVLVRVVSYPIIERQTETFIGIVQVAEPLVHMQGTMDRLRNLMFVGLGTGFLLTLIGSYMLAGRSLQPLTQITATARAIGSSGDLSRRITPPDTRDEVQALVETFNAMLARLDDAFTAERRFVSDASHELRTPLTALRGNAEILLRQIEADRLDKDDLREVLTDIRDESERMGRLVQNLLTLARADVGWRPDLETVQLDIVASDAARVAAPLARNHRFIVQVDEEIDAIGNADQLKQLLLILLDNAFTYTPAGGDIELIVRRNDGNPEIIVRDSGPGMPKEQLERIYDRFYRGDAAREGRTSGAGLGLAIARWIVECHHGEIKAESAPQSGTEVIVQLRYPVEQTAEHKSITPVSRAAQAPASVVGDG